MDVLPSFIPINLDGMSIFTAITFFFVFIGAGVMVNYMKQELTRINDEIQKHEKKLGETQVDISEMKTNIALTLQTVTRMEKILDRKHKD
jgi:cell division protein FtsL